MKPVLALIIVAFAVIALTEAVAHGLDALKISSPLLSCTDNDTLTMQADALQYRPNHSILKSAYKEWWFFTINDPEQKFAAVLGYSLSDPSKSFGKDSSGIASMVWENYAPGVIPSPVITTTDVYAFGDYSGNTENATLSISSSTITVLDENTYHLVGVSKDGSVRWDLTYAQESYPSREIFQAAGVSLDWISYMPSANVSGAFTVNGKQYTLSGALGYHDHNWGAWPDTVFNWIWAQFNSNTATRRFALVLGGYHVPLTSTYIGYVFVRYNGVRHKLGTLCGDKFSYEPLQFKADGSRQYAVHSRTSTASAQYKLDIEYTALVSSLNPSGAGLGLYVYEQISQYSVQWSESDGSGGWRLLEDMQGPGFNEWSLSML